jgi:hypothetical protein
MSATVQIPSADRPVGPAPVTTGHSVHWNWLGLWVSLTVFAVFEVVKHGYVNGSAADAAMLTAAAVGFFVAPDLTFVIGAGQPVPHGHISPLAVPWYNALHRMLVPLVLTAIIGIAFAPLAFVPLALFVGGLSWMAHIALDRAAGYGLRNPDGSRSRA